MREGINVETYWGEGSHWGKWFGQCKRGIGTEVVLVYCVDQELKHSTHVSLKCIKMEHVSGIFGIKSDLFLTNLGGDKPLCPGGFEKHIQKHKASKAKAKTTIFLWVYSKL